MGKYKKKDEINCKRSLNYKTFRLKGRYGKLPKEMYGRLKASDKREKSEDKE